MTEQTRERSEGNGAPFHASKHALFCFRSLKFLPSPYQAEDQARYAIKRIAPLIITLTALLLRFHDRMPLAYFCLSSLSLLPSTCLSPTNDPSLSALDVLFKPEQRQGYIDWVYEQQSPGGGFRGGDSMAAVGVGESAVHQDSSINLVPLASQRDQDDFDRLMGYPDSDSDSHSGEENASETPSPAPPSQLEHPLAPANLIQTYTAILILGILKDDFRRLDRKALLRFIARCQNGDGSFLQFPSCPEAGDPRSTYAAFVLASMLDDWSSIDLEAALAFLITCQRPDGGFATGPRSEAQGGTTYCSIACFSLASRLHSLPAPQDLLRSLVGKQVAPVATPPSTTSSPSTTSTSAEDPDPDPRPLAGFQGRLSKPPDACYSFWTVASLSLISPLFETPEQSRGSEPIPSARKWYNPSMDREWLLSCQHAVYGGIARKSGAMPDVYHTYLSLAALSLGSDPSSRKDLGLAPLVPGWNCSVKVKDYLQQQRRLRAK
ncbi:BZ3500_MvSof-1268-A1-R1_Chr3-1g06058 [Microbotryum saponariae]|uniref:BZ3500_MvSof-1268-A1-R1_Chr3-1g06058 protein n=1 Tax=Microbotryum saponariae TaxID=289078 RepID=A0A2X0L264_9BASI|nr:BZ3500_MvSof-1268-A1-R1_Chr3-1g06058 [Microbotryum saponariae]SDA03880.1 BZ3501_MvSof-1269-A2-R1_Chr3-2g05743 [Microbotryum saponariae]